MQSPGACRKQQWAACPCATCSMLPDGVHKAASSWRPSDKQEAADHGFNFNGCEQDTGWQSISPKVRLLQEAKTERWMT